MTCHYAMVEQPDEASEATTWLEEVTNEQYRSADDALNGDL